MPDGRIGRFEVPEGTSPEQAQAMITEQISGNRKKLMSEEDSITKAAKSFNEESSFGQNLLAGTGKAFSDIGRGVAQLTPWGPSKAEIDAIARRDAPLMETGGGITGNIAGNIAAMLPASLIPGVNTVAGGAALGGLSSMMAPVGENDSRVERGIYGTAAGAAIPSVIRGAGSLVSRGKNLVDSLLPGGTERLGNRVISNVAGDKRQEVINSLLANRPSIPRSNAIAGEASVPSNSAEFAALQKIVKGRLPSDYDAIEQAQKAARTIALQTIGGRGADDTALNSAITARKVSSDPFYKAVETSTAKVQVNPVISEVDKLLSLHPNEDAIAGPLMKIKGALMPDGKTLETNPQALASLSKNIKTMLGRKTPDGQHEFDVKVLTSIKTLLDDQIEKGEPAYKMARTTFKAGSEPINRMQVGQVLEDRLANVTGKETASPFLKVMEDPTLQMGKATGFKRFKDLGQVLHPGEVQTAENVGKELERSVRFNELAAKGMERAKSIVGESEPQLYPTGMFSPILSVTRGILNRSLGKADEKSLAYIAELMKDPQATARAMQIATPAQQGQLLNFMAKYKSPLLIGAPFSAISQGLLSQPQSALLNPEQR